MSRLLFITILSGIWAASTGATQAQQFEYFSNIMDVTGQAGWDQFSPLDPGNYAGPHAADVIETGLSNSFVSVTPGGFKAGPDLYAFLSTPTWSITVNTASTTEAFTSIALQVATTPPAVGDDLDNTSFLLNGIAPDEFIAFGPRTTLSAGGGQPPQDVNYYWASWNGLNAESSYELNVGPGGNHAVFAAARVDYVNTSDSNYQISAVPEPATGVLLICLGIAATLKRRRQVTNN
ncbi:MAG: PEP-CTERM sorting domain-containing protein [Pirellulaceae bacterium]